MKNIYVCGPTVYSNVHIGNLRPILTFDLYIRSLKQLGEQVNFIHNVTDIDDKIIARAKLENISEDEVANKYASHYFSLLEKLNVERPNVTPFVTKHMGDIINFIDALIQKGNAYVVDGNVYFSVESIPQYGHLSKRKLDELVFEEGTNKKHPADFALWKNTNEGIKFDSPWGQGRPGWHTECAVFVDKYNNGQSLDVHGGGIDLLFPHHENEDVQYVAKNGIEISKEWKHIGHIFLDGQKMSKSIGNVFDGETFINQYGVDTLRALFLISNVTAPLEVNDSTIDNAKDVVAKWEKAFKQAQLVKITKLETSVANEIAKEISDWNFAHANKKINEVVKAFNKNQSNETANEVIAVMILLGFSFTKFLISEETKQIFNKWNELRKQGNYAEADKLRASLIELGII